MQPTITNYLKAGYPALFLRTAEPKVAEDSVLSAALELKLDQEGIRFAVWKVTTGMMLRGLTDKPTDARAQTSDLLPSLKFIQDIDVKNGDRPIIAVFHNVRFFMGNYQVVQQLHDAIMGAKGTGSHIILVGPQIELPPELKNLITYVDVPLPTRDQIAGEFTKLVRVYRDRMKKLPTDEDEVKALITDAATSAIGLDRMGAENAFALSLAVTKTIDLRLITAQKEQEVRKSDVLEFVPVEETMDEVGGMAEFKPWLDRRSAAFSEKARKYGLPYPKGILLVGPAGTGKSLACKATAAFLKLPLLRLDMGKIFRSLQGESESAVRLALRVVEAVAPVVLWIDEIEKGLAGMKGSGELDSGVTSRVISTLLTWLQETKAPVFMAAAANDVDRLPSMVYRKGRIDEVWATDLPTLEERMEIFSIHLRKRKRDPEKFDLQKLASRANAFVGAEIEGVIIDAMYAAFAKDDEVTTKYILRAIKETTPQAVRNAEEIRSIREWVKTRARLVSGRVDLVPVDEGSNVRKIRNED